MQIYKSQIIFAGYYAISPTTITTLDSKTIKISHKTEYRYDAKKRLYIKIHENIKLTQVEIVKKLQTTNDSRKFHNILKI